MDTKKENTYLQGIRRNKMPRKTTKSKIKKTITRKPRKTSRRKSSTDRRRKSNPIDTFWTKVINGMKKLLSPAFSKK